MLIFRPRIIIIAAYAAHNKCIGKNGQLPFRLPQDLQRFKKITMGKPIIMGRKTYESIGRILPGRENIIISGSIQNDIKGFAVCNELKQGLKYACWRMGEGAKFSDSTIAAKEFRTLWEQGYKRGASRSVDDVSYTDVMIIGGSQIYAQTINMAQYMHITEVDAEVEGCDAFFPKYDIDEWNIIKEKSYDDGGIPCIYRQLERKSWSQSQAHK